MACSPSLQGKAAAAITVKAKRAEQQTAEQRPNLQPEKVPGSDVVDLLTGQIYMEIALCSNLKLRDFTLSFQVSAR